MVSIMVSVASTWSLLFQARKLKGVIDLDQCEQVSRYFLVTIIEIVTIIIIIVDFAHFAHSYRGECVFL